MLDADRETLKDKLIDLMVMRTTGEEAAPFVRADGTFGLFCGEKMGGLQSAYHLIDALKTGGLFDDEQAPDTELDAAMYVFTLDRVIEPFAGVRIFWNETRQMQVEVKTDKPLDSVLQALDAGLVEAKNDVRRRFNEKAKWEDNALRDVKRDKMQSILGAALDREFFNGHVAYRLEKDLGVSKVSFAEELPDAGEQRLLRDARPKQSFSFSMEKAGETHPSDFSYDLGKTVFTGKVAVHMSQDFQQREKLSLNIRGTAARLAADILDNDSTGARAVAARIADSIGPAALEKLNTEIEKHDRTRHTVDGLTEGTRAKITPLATPKFRARTP